MESLRIFYRKDGLMNKIDINGLVLVEGFDKYVKFHTTEGVHLVRTSIDQALENLPKDQFARIHRSYVVAIDQVTVIGKDWLSLTAMPDLQLPVTRRFYKNLLEKIVLLG